MKCLLATASVALLLVATGHQFVQASPAEDAVTSLPDFNGTLPSKHFSGYLNASGNSFLHYYAVECIERDPATAPVVLWMNGGPGCSSMDGWGYELGPFHFRNKGMPGPLFELNPHTWARRANLIFLEAPPGVGFSYREDGNYTISDTENARNNFEAVKFFFDNKFPEWKSNKFYVAGESYGGVYVPTLADVIFKSGEMPNFNGILVGNGVTIDTNEFFAQGDFVFDHGHGLISEETYEDLEKYCGDAPGSKTQDPKRCAEAGKRYYNQTDFLNMYGYTYYCFEEPRNSWKYIPAIRNRLNWYAQAENNPTGRQLTLDEAMRVRAEQQQMRARSSRRVEQEGGNVPPSPQGGNVPCIDSTTMTTYLNREDVKAALHVKQELTWSICYEIDYKSNVESTVPIWKTLIDAKLPVLFYSGNVDRSVPYTGTLAWIKSGGFNKTQETLGWVFEDPDFVYGPQPGGLWEQYDNYFTFIRVNGAGHMVPQFRPAAAFVMFAGYMEMIESRFGGNVGMPKEDPQSLTHRIFHH